MIASLPEWLTGPFARFCAAAIAVAGLMGWFLKDSWPYCKKMLAIYLRNRVKVGIETDLRKRTPVGTNFFESDVKRHMGIFRFFFLVVMDDLEKEGWCIRLEGIDAERGIRYQRKFF